MRGLAVILFVVGCGRLGFDPSSSETNGSGPDVSAFAWRKPITVAASLSASPLAEFPLLVSTTDAELAAHARADGADLAFVDARGVAIPFELATWQVGPSPLLVAWVRVPRIDAGVTTQLYLYYGDANAMPGSDAAATWEGYRGVWHLDDDPSGSVHDSSPIANDGTPKTGATPGPVRASGVIGGAMTFDGVDDYIDLGAPPSLTSFTFTASAWANTTGTNNDYILDYAGPAVDPARVSLAFANGAARLVTRNDAITETEYIGTSDLRDSWHYIVGTGDGANGRLYVDGALVGAFALPVAPVTTPRAAIGRHIRQAPCCELTGTLDDVRFAEAARSGDWIAAEFRNQGQPDRYVAVGAEERAP